MSALVPQTSQRTERIRTTLLRVRSAAATERATARSATYPFDTIIVSSGDTSSRCLPRTSADHSAPVVAGGFSNTVAPHGSASVFSSSLGAKLTGETEGIVKPGTGNRERGTGRADGAGVVPSGAPAEVSFRAEARSAAGVIPSGARAERPRSRGIAILPVEGQAPRSGRR
jgi:hypothetical protein